MEESPLQLDDHVFDPDEVIQLSFLRDEETDALISAQLLDPSLCLSSPLDQRVTFDLREVALHVTAGELYPVQAPTWEVENRSLPREQADILRRRLRQIVADAEAAANNLEKWRSREDESSNSFGIFKPIMVVLLLAQETVRHIDAYHSKRLSAGKSSANASKPDENTWFLGHDVKKAAPEAPLTTSTMRETAFQILQSTPAQIASQVPDYFRVLHVEQVLRPDLARDFQTFQDRLRRHLSRESVNKLRPFMPQELRATHRIEDMVDHLVKPRITFHGTQRQHVPSIVRHGFIPPGKYNPSTGAEHAVRCGSTYGRGVYSTPSARFALSYSDGCVRTRPSEYFGLKLIVCATIMGRTRVMYREDGWREEEEVYEGADSHVANDGFEYIVFDRAQTIPVYVVHLDWGADNAEYFQALPDDPAAWAREASSRDRRTRAAAKKLAPDMSCPGDRQRAKESVYARASKWFPYGYGPAEGTRFVVEEVGDVSEDEEEYGEYQDLRGDDDDNEDGGVGSSDTNFWAWVKVASVEEDASETGKSLEGLHWADEYGHERKALKVPVGYGKKAVDWDEMAAPGSEVAEREAQAKKDEGFYLDRLMLEMEEA